MNSFKELYEKVVGLGYDYGTGSWTYLNEDIKIKMNEYGEFVPYKDSKIEIDKECLKKLEKSTLSLAGNPSEDEISNVLFSNIDSIKYDSRLGYYLDLYAGYVKEGHYREEGSSGGFGTWILKELLEKKYVDSVIHVKESTKKDLLFDYQISTTIEEVMKGAKTKYYPVEFSEVMKTVKNNPGKYAIVGVPSFIMSFHLLAELDPILKERVLFTVGLICGHQKSSKFVEYLGWQSGFEPGNLKYVNFRKKDVNSPSDDYNIEFIGEINGKKVSKERKMSELNGRNWGQGFFKVKASDFNDDVMNETADITLGDAWLPEYTKDSLGTNVIIVRNPIINEIIRQGIIEDKIEIDKLDKEKIYKSQAAHYRHSRDEMSYRLFKKKKNNIWYPNKRVKPNNNITFTRKKIQDLREKISDESRYQYQIAVKKNNIDYFDLKMKPLIKKYDFYYKVLRLKKLGFTGIVRKVSTKIRSK